MVASFSNPPIFQSGPFLGPLFIVGAPRSGTTLIRDLLNRHPDIGIPDEETQFLPELIHKYGIYPKLKKDSIRQKFIQTLEHTNFCELMKKKHRSFDRTVVEQACFKENIAAIFETVIRSYIPTQKLSNPNLIWGDKTPFYAQHLPLLAKLYKDARYLHIIRDSRDVAYSGRNAWGKSFVRSSVDWRDTIRSVWAFREQYGTPPPLLEIRYEDLLSNTESVIKKVARFCGVDFMPEMLSLTQSSETWGHGKGATSILRNNSRNFLKYGNRTDIERIEEITYHELAACGYDIMYAKKAKSETKNELLLNKFLDGILILNVYMREKGVFEGIKYKLKQRHIRKPTNSTIQTVK